jgi:hypothetical protein
MAAVLHRERHCYFECRCHTGMISVTHRRFKEDGIGKVDHGDMDAAEIDEEGKSLSQNKGLP